MSRAKFIIDLLNQNEKTVIEETALFNETTILASDLCQNKVNLYESAPPSVLSPKTDIPSMHPPHSAPLLAETYHDVDFVENLGPEETFRESPYSAISGIERIDSSPVEDFSDSSLSWIPDSDEDGKTNKGRVIVAPSDSDSDSEEYFSFKRKKQRKSNVYEYQSTTENNYTNYIDEAGGHLQQELLSESNLKCLGITAVETLIPTEQTDIVTTAGSSIADTNNTSVEPTRWKKSDPSKWKKNIAKSNKQSGLPYLNKKGNLMPAKRPKVVKCYIKCRYQCQNNFTEDDRVKICEDYWKIADFRAQKQFLIEKVEAQSIKTKKIGTEKSRSVSYAYYFNKSGSAIRVCKDFFLKTLCISNGPVNEAMRYKNELGNYSGNDGRGSRVPSNKTSAESEQKIIDHINSFPRLESHYCRKKTKRQYLDSKLSIAKMYELYKEKLTATNEVPCSFYVYKGIFGSKFNLSFFTPKKDLCMTCTRYDSAGRPEHLKDEYNLHIIRKNAAQEAKEMDKQRSINDENYLVVTADMQSTLHVPVSGVGILYYTRKLNVQNYTIHTAKPPHEAYCVTWNEINGKRGSVEIASAMNWWISQIPSNIKEVTIYSDTCAGQNRNQFITAYLTHLIQRSDMQLEVIEQKFLESGHSHMEVDSMHSAIERQARHTQVYSMIDWKCIMERARSKRHREAAPPYIVKELNYSEMIDVKALNEKFVKNTSIDKDGKKIKWLKIKCLRFEKKCPGLVKFRYSHDGPYSELTLFECQIKTILMTRKRRQEIHTQHPGTEELEQDIKNYVIPKAYSCPLPISEAKKKDLINLCIKGIIPQELHLWYESLPTSKDVIDRILEPDVTEQGEEEEGL